MGDAKIEIDYVSLLAIPNQPVSELDQNLLAGFFI